MGSVEIGVRRDVKCHGRSYAEPTKNACSIRPDFREGLSVEPPESLRFSSPWPPTTVGPIPVSIGRERTLVSSRAVESRLQAVGTTLSLSVLP